MKDVIFKVYRYFIRKVRGVKVNEKIEELKELLTDYGLVKKEEKKTNPFVIALAIIGGICAIAGALYAIWYFFCPEDSEYFEDFDEDEEFEDDDLEGDE